MGFKVKVCFFFSLNVLEVSLKSQREAAFTAVLCSCVKRSGANLGSLDCYNYQAPGTGG